MRKQKKALMSRLESALALCDMILRQGNITEERAELLNKLVAKLKKIQESLAEQEKSAVGKLFRPAMVTTVSATIGKIAELILDFFSKSG